MPGGSMGPYKKSRCQNVLHVRNKKAASCKASGARMSSRSKTKRSIGEVQPSGFFKRKTFIRWRDIEEGFASYRRDKNWAETRGESGRLRFQSLVGTIKTPKMLVPSSFSVWSYFQHSTFQKFCQ
ncbi:Uncharacterised protein [[Flavobacterium] thermophilum]|nr:hypothetical protein GARCT_00366 [Geobacillus sp. 12AMOR1]STO36665.1 Uncharacterised protein [[Flavobacterium] thermophilum]